MTYLNSFFMQTSTLHTMTVFHQNIAGLLNKLVFLEVCVDDFLQRKEIIDIICLTETFIKSGNESNIHMKDYQLVTYFSRRKENRGGVCILARRSLECKIVPFCKEISTEKSFECCGIQLPSIKCFVIALYRTPNSNVDLYLHKLDLLLHKLTINKNYKIIIAGDFNIDILRNNNLTTRFKDLILNYGLKSHIQEPTRKFTCIDNIISNYSDGKGKIHELHLSDHNTGQSLTFPVTKKNVFSDYWYIESRNYCNENISKFKNFLFALSWSDVLSENNLNRAFSKFYDNFQFLYNLCFPINTIKINSNSKRTPKWITKGIKRSCKRKRELRYQYYK